MGYIDFAIYLKWYISVSHCKIHFFWINVQFIMEGTAVITRVLLSDMLDVLGIDMEGEKKAQVKYTISSIFMVS